ncbi:hypothetical protein WJX73_010437 [Symbiochloris irregularis]|uniref:Glycylpeptide N-tetradecanoyltransferase n=1 Tax=Symbiochloris irregularis TaxID=706552 RepID=A0AAW1Q4R1_9CHLO
MPPKKATKQQDAALPQANGQASEEATPDGQLARAASQGPKEGNIAELLEKLGLAAAGAPAGHSENQPKDRYAFWETQPVPQYSEQADGKQAEDGPIDPVKTVADVRQDPYNLPAGYEWSTCDLTDTATVKEIFELLELNYVEDDDAMFRFKYSQQFLQWALHPPGYFPDWHVGVRVSTTRKLVGFITGVPASVHMAGKPLQVAEINFLCVHKKLRSKRLAPVLIKEVTRRVNLRGLWQAAYTAGVVLPKPVATCQYWHRSLNPKKLISINFSRIAPRMTMARTLKLYKLPEATVTPGLRPLTKADVPQVAALMSRYLSKFQLAPRFTEAEVEHYLMPVTDVIDSHVVEAPNGDITDLLSYYTLPSSVLGNDKYDTLKAAFMYYTVAGATPLHQLMNDALILAHQRGHDVFNALDIFENRSILEKLKFGIGDGSLRYYLYNWRSSARLSPADVGLILL